MLYFHANASDTHDAAIKTLRKNQKITTSQKESRIIFVLSGKVILEMPDSTFIEKGEGDIIFWPPNIDCTIQTITELKYIRLLIPDVVPLLHHFIPEGKHLNEDNEDYLFYTLKMNPTVNMFISSLIEYIRQNRMDNKLAEIKTLELFFLLTHCYDIEETCRFFAPSLSKNHKFYYFILSNVHKVKTVEEFAALSSYSLSGFEKQFQKVFGMPPYKWMIGKKKERLYREITGTEKPIKQIAYEHGFSSLSQLSDFCRKFLGDPPIILRKKQEF